MFDNLRAFLPEREKKKNFVVLLLFVWRSMKISCSNVFSYRPSFKHFFLCLLIVNLTSFSKPFHIAPPYPIRVLSVPVTWTILRKSRYRFMLSSDTMHAFLYSLRKVNLSPNPKTQISLYRLFLFFFHTNIKFAFSFFLSHHFLSSSSSSVSLRSSLLAIILSPLFRQVIEFNFYIFIKLNVHSLVFLKTGQCFHVTGLSAEDLFLKHLSTFFCPVFLNRVSSSFLVQLTTSFFSFLKKKIVYFITMGLTMCVCFF